MFKKKKNKKKKKKTELYKMSTTDENCKFLACCVCHESLGNGTLACLKCGHIFHGDCIDQCLAASSKVTETGSLEGECPLCRRETSSSGYVRFSPEMIAVVPETSNSTPIAVTLRINKSEPQQEQLQQSITERSQALIIRQLQQEKSALRRQLDEFQERRGTFFYIIGNTYPIKDALRQLLWGGSNKLIWYSNKKSWGGYVNSTDPFTVKTAIIPPLEAVLSKVRHQIGDVDYTAEGLFISVREAHHLSLVSTSSMPQNSDPSSQVDQQTQRTLLENAEKVKLVLSENYALRRKVKKLKEKQECSKKVWLDRMRHHKQMIKRRKTVDDDESTDTEIAAVAEKEEKEWDDVDSFTESEVSLSSDSSSSSSSSTSSSAASDDSLVVKVHAPGDLSGPVLTYRAETIRQFIRSSPTPQQIKTLSDTTNCRPSLSAVRRWAKRLIGAGFSSDYSLNDLRATHYIIHGKLPDGMPFPTLDIILNPTNHPSKRKRLVRCGSSSS